MDRILAALVRIFAFAARFTDQTDSALPSGTSSPAPLKILLVGYNGARNTGADVRVSALIDQFNDVFGPENIQMTLMTLDAGSSETYLQDNVKLLPFDTIFFNALLKACSTHDVIIACEGSMLKSKFANGLTLFLCQAAGTARSQRKPCIAYGVEAGEMDGFVERTARDLCQDAMMIARTPQSLDIIRSLRLNSLLGTDSAWTFDSSRGHDAALALLREGGWDEQRPLLGIAPINPFCWPAKPSLLKLARSVVTGNWENHYQKFYYLSSSPQRKRAFDAYLRALAQSVNAYCAEHGCQPVIIGMEKLDEQACRKLEGMLDQPSIVVLSNDHDGFTIGEVVGQLNAIVTSRYHAGLLAMARGIVPIGVSMDERLDNLLHHARLPEELLLHVDDPDLSRNLSRSLEWARAHAGAEVMALGEYVRAQRAACKSMAKLAHDAIVGCNAPGKQRATAATAEKPPAHSAPRTAAPRPRLCKDQL